MGTTVHTNKVNASLKVAHIELGAAVHILGNHHLAKSVVNFGKTFTFHIENAGGRVRIDGELRSINILNANTGNCQNSFIAAFTIHLHGEVIGFTSFEDKVIFTSIIATSNPHSVTRSRIGDTVIISASRNCNGFNTIINHVGSAQITIGILGDFVFKFCINSCGNIS